MTRIAKGVVRAGVRSWPALAAAVAACAWFACPPRAAAQAAGGDLKRLAGVWYVAAEEFHGKQTPRENLAGAKHTLTVTGDQFVFESGLPDGTRAAHRGTAVLGESARPRRFDWTGTGPKGAPLERLGLYELTADEFRLVYAQRRVKKDGPLARPAAFRATAEDDHTLLTFRRKPPGAAAEPGPAAPPDPGEKIARAVRPLLTRFPHRAQAGPVTVFSDISKQFSQDHARHAENVWAYYSKLHGKSPGDKTEIYYTRDRDVYKPIADLTGTLQLPAARAVAGLWDKDHMVFFIIPYKEPDFGTLQHELHHTFLYTVYPRGQEFPWFAEGIAMYFEDGWFDKKGTLVVEPSLTGWYWGLVQKGAGKQDLIPLQDLLTMGRDKFYAPPVHKAYAQSMALLNYLMKQHPKVMKDIIDQMNKGEVRDNDRLLELLRAGLKMDVKALEKKYTDFALGIKR